MTTGTWQEVANLQNQLPEFDGTVSGIVKAPATISPNSYLSATGDFTAISGSTSFVLVEGVPVSDAYPVGTLALDKTTGLVYEYTAGSAGLYGPEELLDADFLLADGSWKNFSSGVSQSGGQMIWSATANNASCEQDWTGPAGDYRLIVDFDPDSYVQGGLDIMFVGGTATEHGDTNTDMIVLDHLDPEASGGTHVATFTLLYSNHTDIRLACRGNSTFIINSVSLQEVLSVPVPADPEWTPEIYLGVGNTTRTAEQLAFTRKLFPDKPDGQPIFISAFGQSLLTPFGLIDTTTPANTNIYDWQSDEAGPPSWSFVPLDITDTLKSDYDSNEIYTGHTLGDRSSVVHGMAQSLYELTGLDVYVEITHWVGKGHVTYFWPFQDNDGGGEGTGYTEFRTQMKAIQAAGVTGLPSVPDIHLYLTGATDSSLATESQWLEYLLDTDRELERDGVLGPDTIRGFVDFNSDTDTVQRWNIYRAAHSAIEKPSVLFPFIGNTIDSLHYSGDSQYLTGYEGARSLADFNRAKAQPPGARFIRSTRQITTYSDYKTASDTEPTLGTGGWNTDTGSPVTKLRLPFRAYPIAGSTAQPHMTFVEQVREGWRVRIEETATPANYCIYLVEDDGAWNDSGDLPEAAGEPDHREFTVSVVESNAWPPDVDDECEIIVQRPVSSSWGQAYLGVKENDDWDTGGFSVSKAVFPFGAPPVSLAGISGSATIPVTVGGGQYTLLNAGGGVVDTPVAAGRFVWDHPKPAGAYALFEYGGSIRPDDNIRGILSGKLRLSGRQVTNPANNKVYAAEVKFLSNFHTVGTSQSSVATTVGTVDVLFNPLPSSFSSPLLVDTDGAFVRNVWFQVPIHATEDWHWTISIDYQWTEY